jgi:hypothetical protein
MSKPHPHEARTLTATFGAVQSQTLHLLKLDARDASGTAGVVALRDKLDLLSEDPRSCSLYTTACDRAVIVASGPGGSIHMVFDLSDAALCSHLSVAARNQWLELIASTNSGTQCEYFWLDYEESLQLVRLAGAAGGRHPDEMEIICNTQIWEKRILRAAAQSGQLRSGPHWIVHFFGDTKMHLNNLREAVRASVRWC